MKTLDELRTLSPCREGLEWAAAQPSLFEAWQNCERGDWMLWFLCRRQLLSKEQSVSITQDCAEAAKRHAATRAADAATRAADAAAAWAAAARAAAAWAADARAAVRAAYAARAADAAADAAAAWAADAAAERKRQADFIRTLVPNPFQP